MGGGINEKLLEIDDDLGEPDSSLKDKIWSEMKNLWIVAGPAILIPFSTFGIHVISQAFIGQFNATELAAYALIFTVIFRVVLGVQVVQFLIHM